MKELTKGGYAGILILSGQMRIPVLRTQKNHVANTTKLTDIRCTHEKKQEIMEHARKLGKPLSRYVLDLLQKDIKAIGEETFSRVRTSMKYTQVSVLIPEDMRRHLEGIRTKTGVSLSEQIRRIVMASHGAREIEHRELDELIKTNNLLVALGRNLNQLTRKANSGDSVAVADILLHNLNESVDLAMADIQKLRADIGV